MALTNTAIYTDFAALNELKAKARGDKSNALDEVARQFETLFTSMMLKSMRDANLGDGLFDSDNLKQYRDMYDQQLSMHIAQNGGMGLVDVLKQQLAGLEMIKAAKNRSVQDYLDNPVKQAQASEQVSATTTAAEFDGSVQTFVDELLPYAEKAATALGLEPAALLAQAALETGWGQHLMKMANGQSSHNLFGIKADERWQGKQASVSTLEYRDGVAQRERAHFRAYDSFQQAFDDYAEFVGGNGRYRQAISNSNDPQQYFRHLQQAGYATDPDYADKVLQIFQRGDIQRAVQQAAAGDANAADDVISS
ncbi:MAG: flagellar assembly peptidoglycan hydrolase FlgJ [Chromatiales bacterium]|jgi:flagellar protein FlgJ